MAYNLNNMMRIAQVGAMNRPQFRNMPTLDFADAIDNYFNAKDAAEKRAQMAEQAQKYDAYTQALQSGNQDAINKAWAAYDPQGYSNYINSQQQREQDRQWQLEDMARKEQAAINLASIKNNLSNAAAQAERERENAQLDEALASGLITKEQYDMKKRMQVLGDIATGGVGGKGGFGTTPAGLALAISQNPDQFNEAAKTWANNFLNSADPDYVYGNAFQKAAGKGAAELEYKPQLKLAEETAKNNAEIMEKTSAFEASMPSFIDMTNELISLADKATYTKAGRIRDAILRETGQPMSEGGIAREKYKQVVANELIPHLKEMFGGQLSDSEREALLGTLGDPNLSPEEKKAAVSSFIESKQRQMGSYKRRVTNKNGGATVDYKSKYGLE